ncbi:SDR family oxidoreductase [Mesorhizobium sp. KR9-304]|uniref:SDR family NAD(P)-dependent oxidoreductase n=1 Tax=Mesorhizobium sp. KR9-304 TaxID=3156614 RepID=UPI0032B3E7F7
MSRIEDRGTAVVTGASSGLGAVYAERLAGQGYDLVLVARRADRLEALAEAIRRKHGRSVSAFAADLADDGDLRRLEERIAGDGNITLLVNNAGIGGQKVVAEADAEDIAKQIKVNVVALSRLTRAVLPGLIGKGEGAVVNIASILAFDTGFGGIYSGTKAYVVNFTEGLQRELEGTGVKAQVVLPGPIRTEFWDIAGGDISALPPEYIMTAEDLVDAALAGLAQGEAFTAPGLADLAEVEKYRQARGAFYGKLVAGKPAARYAA